MPKDTGDLDPSIVKRMAPWLPYASYVGLAGNGEPFLHPELFDILETIRRADSVPSIVTNGTLLTEQNMRKLIQLGPSILVISFDGGTKETFESIRVGANFDRIIHSLELLNHLKSKGHNPYPIVNFLVCVMHQNKNELMDIILWAKKLNVSKVSFQTVYPFTEEGRRSMISDLGEVHDVVEPARRKAADLGIDTTLAPLSFGLEQRLRYEGRKLPANQPLFCENIWHTLHVGIKGDVYYCCFWAGESLGNLAEQSLPDLWNHPNFQHFRERIRQGNPHELCQKCHVLECHNPEKITKQMQLELEGLKSR